jgi:hypothetical protein
MIWKGMQDPWHRFSRATYRTTGHTRTINMNHADGIRSENVQLQAFTVNHELHKRRQEWDTGGIIGAEPAHTGQESCRLDPNSTIIGTSYCGTFYDLRTTTMKSIKACHHLDLWCPGYAVLCVCHPSYRLDPLLWLSRVLPSQGARWPQIQVRWTSQAHRNTVLTPTAQRVLHRKDPSAGVSMGCLPQC